jgi:alpha-aminoadipate carrier protein LysW
MPSCPECDETLEIDEETIEEGEIIICPGCGAELEVMETSPLELDVIPEDDD